MLTINKSNIGGLLLVFDKFRMFYKNVATNLFDVRIGRLILKENNKMNI